MKRLITLIILCALTFGLLTNDALASEHEKPAKAPTPGAEVATAISTVTGVAISPLFGTGAVGAYRYVHASTEAERAKLPWFAQPWFFIPALIVVGICALKDVFGLAIPTALKKPFDVLETVEHKVSGLVAAGAFVPMVASVFREANLAAPSSLGAGAMMGHGYLAAVDISWLYNIISVPIALAAFVVVFLASNAINILILLSPFGTVDAALKSFRVFILSSVTVSSFANPYAGAVWSLIIIFLAWFIAGWSFRLSHLGMMYVWEFLSFARTRFAPENTGNKMFLGRARDKVPTRTYGKLVADEKGGFVFHYHPWLVLPERTLTLPAGEYVVGKGLLYSEIEQMTDGHAHLVFLLPPRYRGHEEELGRAKGISGVRDAGLRAAFVWLKERLGFGAKPVAA